MNPQIQITSEDQNQLKFTISGANVSIVNGIRRVLLSNIPTVVFRTFPYSENVSCCDPHTRHVPSIVFNFTSFE